MCYMAEREHPDHVGVRELRQNLSVYLRRVKGGETLQVTERGVPVAELRPRPARPLSRIDQMIADGRIRPATVRPRDIPAPQELPGRPLGEILREMRDEDDR
jgi:prevent-host-death family protein